jgi:hypothetical protein
MVAMAAVVALTGVVQSASAQASVTAADIQRLQESVFDLGSDVARVRAQDPQRADQMQRDLEGLREEVIYLKVKLRKEGSVPRNEYTELRDRIDDLRGRLYANAPTRPAEQATRTTPPPTTTGRQTTTGREDPPTQPVKPSVRSNELPVGTELDVRLQRELSSGTAQVEDRFTATTLVDLMSNGRLVVPAGSIVRGVVSSVDKATRTDRKGSMTLAFDEITIQSRAYPLHATVTQAIESEGIRGEAGKIGTGAGIGAIIGGILGGFKGVLAGILIGAGGTVAATPGKDVVLPQGTVLRIRLDSPLVVNNAAR